MVEERAGSMAADASARIDRTNTMPVYLTAAKYFGIMRRPKGIVAQVMKEEKKMSCCSDMMKPIEASSYCTPQDSAAHAAQAMRDSGCGCVAYG